MGFIIIEFCSTSNIYIYIYIYIYNYKNYKLFLVNSSLHSIPDKK
jgi:hypothetical protein